MGRHDLDEYLCVLPLELVRIALGDFEARVSAYAQFRSAAPFPAGDGVDHATLASRLPCASLPGQLGITGHFDLA